MSRPPKVVIPGLNRGAGIPAGYMVGRRKGKGKGPAELLDLSGVKEMGVATSAQVVQTVAALSSVVSTAIQSISPDIMMGESGEDGQPGPPGQPGATGAAGSAGAAGAAGPAGQPGFALDGLDGEDGMRGQPGATGSTGATGPQGPIGLGLDGDDGQDGMPMPGDPKVSKSGDTMTGGLTVNPSTAAEQYLAFGRIGVGLPVPYFTPTQNNQWLALDIFPKGTPGNNSTFRGPTWIDVCSTDILNDGTNFECLRVTKLVDGAAIVGAAKGGTGVVQPLVLQQDKGALIVGANVTPESFSGTVPIVQITSIDTDSLFAGLSAFRWGATAGTAFEIDLVRSRGTTVLGRGAVLDGDRLGQLAFYGDDGTNFQAGALIRGSVQGAPASGSVPGLVSIFTRPVGGALTERLRVDNVGNLLLFGPGLSIAETAAASVPTPAANRQAIFIDTDHVAKLKNSAGVTSLIGLTGPVGPQGPIGFGMDGDIGEEAMRIPGVPGPQGPQGSVGPQGSIGFGLDGIDGEEGMAIPGVPGAAGAAGGLTPYIAVPSFRGNSGQVFTFGNCGGHSITIPVNCTIKNIVVFVATANASSQVAPAIYSIDGAGNMNALLAQGSLVTGMAFGINTLPLTSPLAVTKGQTLWICVQVLVSSLTIAATETISGAYFAATGALPSTAAVGPYGSLGIAVWPEVA